MQAGQRPGEHLQHQAMGGEMIGRCGELDGVPAQMLHLIDGEDDAAVRGMGLDLAGQRERGIELRAAPDPGADLLGEDLASADAVCGERVQL